jgi:DNA-binding transcriptional ArsR family regulator
MASFARQARLLKTCGHPARLRLLHLLAREEACVCHLSAALHLAQPAVSQHLMALRRAGAVVSRRDGKNVFYRLTGDDIPQLLDAVGQVSGGMPDMSQIGAAEKCPCPRCQTARQSKATAHSAALPDTAAPKETLS